MDVKKYLIFTCLLCCILSIMNVNAQEPLFKNYSRENGFPSPLGFCLVQDSNQFIWACTNNGICRFDGRHVKTFLPQNSPTDYGAFHLYSDSHHRIWVISILSPPVYYLHGAFHELDSALKSKVADTRWITEDSKGSLYFLTKNGTIIKWNGKEAYEEATNMPLFFSGGQFINDSILIAAAGGSVIYRITNLHVVEKLPVKGYQQDYNRFYKVKNNLVIGSSCDGLYQYTDKGQQQLWKYAKESSEIYYCLYPENDTTFWMGSKDGICIFLYKNNHLELLKKMLPGKSVFSIIKDTNGNHWISTGEDGIYFLNAVNALNYNPARPGNHIAQIFFLGDEGYVFNTKGDFFLLKDNGLSYKYNIVANAPDLFFLKAAKRSQNSLLICFRGNRTGILTDGKLKIRNNPFQMSYCSYYYRRDGTFFIKGGVATGDCEVHTIVEGKEKLIGRLPGTLVFKTTFCVDFSNRIWVGRNDTVYCYGSIYDTDQKVEKIFEKNVYVSDIQCDGKNQVWVATKGNGIYCYKDKKKILHYNTGNGLLTNNCSSLYIDDSDDLWMCSESGLNLLQQTKSGEYAIRSYTTDNLLPDNCVSTVGEREHKIYIGTNKGLVVFEKQDMLAATSFPVPCYIASVSIKGRDTAVQDNCILNYGSSISIGFSTIAYNTEKPPTYYYTLNGSGGEWNKTTTEELQYERLAPGKYTFMVYAEGWRSKGASLSFTVLPPYWQKWWFKLLAIAAVFIILFYGFNGVVYYKNRQSELKRKRIENDLKSLRAQINPHFIFNALNSIQDFILDHQPRPANYFLTQFSKLIRMIVDNSGKEYISLEDEIEFMKLYLELEQLRLGDSFSFRIKCDEEIDTSATGIPSMILQPIAENSLVHGLPLKKGEKELLLYFKKNGQMLHCIVTDNGIGRKNARQYENKKHGISMGLNNITERLQLVYAKENIKWQPVEITDIDEDGSTSGTKVSLYIPLMKLN